MNKPTRVLIMAMSTLVIIAITIASYYFKYQNQSIDPRVVRANELYEQYNELTKSTDYHGVFHLMDSIEAIYRNYPHYKNSYEVGILYNNRGAAFLALALKPQITREEKDSLLNKAEINILKSIDIYNSWLNAWGDKGFDEILLMLDTHFGKDDTVFHEKNITRFLNKRADQIIEAQFETNRRLSVSHTNLGMVYRHNEQLDAAVKEYFIALEYWPDNLAAENNLNILLNQPLKKPSILRTFFPKERLN